MASPPDPLAAAFGALMKRLRVETGLSGKKFGVVLGFSRSYVVNIERGQAPSENFVEQLVLRYPEYRERILESYAPIAEAKRRPRKRRAQPIPFHPDIDYLMRHSRYIEAQYELENALSTTSDPSARVDLLGRLGENLFLSCNAAEGSERFIEAIEVAERASLSDEVVGLCDRFGDWLTERWEYDRALSLVDARLALHRNSGVLWRRRGIIRWQQHYFPDAYASLTMALGYGISRSVILFDRGHVLADWGYFDAAISELDEAFAKTPVSVHHAFALSGRAYALASIGEYARAEAEFDRAKAMAPDNGWLPYFRALCHGREGNHTRMIEGLRHALVCRHPTLNRLKFQKAVETLKRHGAEFPAAVSEILREKSDAESIGKLIEDVHG